MQITPLPARPVAPFDATTDWANAPLATLDMQATRTMHRGTYTKQIQGTQEVLTSTLTRLDATTLDDAITAARDLGRDAKGAVAVLQAADGALFATTLRTKVAVGNPAFLQMRDAHGVLNPAAFDHALTPQLRAGYGNYSVDVTPAASDLGAALRAIVTERSVARV